LQQFRQKTGLQIPIEPFGEILAPIRPQHILSPVCVNQNLARLSTFEGESFPRNAPQDYFGPHLGRLCAIIHHCEALRGYGATKCHKGQCDADLLAGSFEVFPCGDLQGLGFDSGGSLCGGFFQLTFTCHCDFYFDV